ncbi:hypothetical protein [Pseudorhodoferax sp. Leaf274]|uniref:hypothetical protein n=1 Tax=Pseudorhodoferax sp. Leaf274 TaxID=1736318 RepID=UPI000702F9B0|nr:hypothetical protein [Pseudorhodoferax sp. Leaf274]KQP43904.1 hypothetical protein ASF44_28670 [Pseudorhodoferax sp. Leaf274]
MEDMPVIDPKIVFAFHPFTRRYVGPFELAFERGDMDPLEPGRWLIPGNCLVDAPPVAGPGQYVVAEIQPSEGDPDVEKVAWALRDIPQPPAPPAPAPEPEPVPPTPEQVRQALVDAIQEYMDDMAQMLGYDDIKTAVTYADEPAVPRFQAEGQALRAWRSLVWAACYEHLALVQAGGAEIPSLEEAIAMLPVFTPPPPVQESAEEGAP